MRVTLRQWQIFQWVAESGTTAAAASALGLSQSAASAAVNALERQLELRVFDRVGKKLQLNDNGRALLPFALTLLDDARAIERWADDRDSQVGALRIGASTTIGNYLLPARLARYRESHPGAHLELRIGNTRDVITAVREFAVDLGFIEGPCHAADLVVLPWLEDELQIVAAPTHPLARAARRRRLDVRQLGEAQWLLREPGSGTLEAAEQALRPHLLNLPSVMTLGSSEAIKNAAAAGLGVSCLSGYAVADFVAAGRLRVLGTRLPRLIRRLALVHHRRKVLSAALRSFIEHCGRGP